MNILGISAYYHDSAACLVKDGEILAAAQEERFTRKKHDYNFPENAIRYCLDYANISGSDLDYVAFYDKPFIKFERLLESYLAYVSSREQTVSHLPFAWSDPERYDGASRLDRNNHWETTSPK